MIHIFTSPKSTLISFFNSTDKNPSFCTRLCHGRLHGRHSCLSVGFDSRRCGEIYKCQDNGEEGCAQTDSKIYVVGSQGQKCAYDCLIFPPFPFYSLSVPPQFLPSFLPSASLCTLAPPVSCNERGIAGFLERLFNNHLRTSSSLYRSVWFFPFLSVQTLSSLRNCLQLWLFTICTYSNKDSGHASVECFVQGKYH